MRVSLEDEIDEYLLRPFLGLYPQICSFLAWKINADYRNEQKVSQKPEGKSCPDKTERKVGSGHIPLLASPATFPVQLGHNSPQSFRVSGISWPAFGINIICHDVML